VDGIVRGGLALDTRMSQHQTEETNKPRIENEKKNRGTRETE
jgi:hypothetical protein